MQKNKRRINTLIHGDCVAILPSLGSEFCDLVITSPPYDDLRTYGGHLFNFISVADSIWGALKPGGVLVWIVSDATKKGSETGTSFEQATYFLNNGFYLHDTMIFEKNTSSFPARIKSKRYTQIFEYMFVLSKDGPPKTANLICDKKNKWVGHTNWGVQTKRKKDGSLKINKDINPVPEMSPRNNIWKYTVSGFFGKKHERAYEHPATFPDKLAEDHILSWSNPGDLVIDPMCGSGTVCRAAKKLERKYLGIDINEDYVNLASELENQD